MEEEVLDKYKVEQGKREAFRGRGAPLEWRRTNDDFLKKLTEKIRSEGRTDAESRWLVTELLAAD